MSTTVWAGEWRYKRMTNEMGDLNTGFAYTRGIGNLFGVSNVPELGFVGVLIPNHNFITGDSVDMKIDNGEIKEFRVIRHKGTFFILLSDAAFEDLKSGNEVKIRYETYEESHTVSFSLEGSSKVLNVIEKD
jgi:hypothetical protein